MRPAHLARLRRVCLAFPEAHEVEAWASPTFRVRNKLFAMFAERGHHGDRNAVWCKAPPGDQELMIRMAPQRYFRPPYVGPSGWVGVWLDRSTDWKELKDILEEAYCMTAPKRLVAQVEGRSAAR